MGTYEVGTCLRPLSPFRNFPLSLFPVPRRDSNSRKYPQVYAKKIQKKKEKLYIKKKT